MTGIPLLYLLLLLNGSLAPGTQPKLQDTNPPKPSVQVTFERQNIREQDTINLDLLIINDSGYDLTNSSLEVNAPSFFEWYVISCDGKKIGQAVVRGVAWPLGSIAARSASRCSLQLKTKSTIEVGEFNTLFIVRYERQVDKKLEKSYVTSEKTLKANLLGSESVAGIPLVLAGFIVPGLIFWLFVNLFKVSWGVEALGDRMIYSVLVSVVLVTAETWMKVVDVNTGVSIGKLVRLGLGGLLAGVLVGAGDLVLRRIRERRVFATQINEGDAELTILGKLLELPAHATMAQPMIAVEGGARYVGSLGAHTEMAVKGRSDKVALYSLVGSFEIKLSAAGTSVRTEIEKLQKAGKMRKLIELARTKQLINTVNKVQNADANGNLTPDVTNRRQWRDAEVAGVTPNTAGWDTQPLAISE